MELCNNSQFCLLTVGSLSISLIKNFGSEQLRQPTGCCISEDGLEIIVCNTYKHCVSKFKATGEFIGNFGGKRYFFYPTKVAVTRQGYVVVDRENSGNGWTGRERINIIDFSGMSTFFNLTTFIQNKLRISY